MRKHIDIVIWDSEAERLHAIERSLRQAMRNLGVSGGISSQSEPPLLGRMGLAHLLKTKEKEVKEVGHER